MDSLPYDVLLDLVHDLLAEGCMSARLVCSSFHEAYSFVVQNMIVEKTSYRVKCRVAKLMVALNGCMTMTPVVPDVLHPGNCRDVVFKTKQPEADTNFVIVIGVWNMKRSGPRYSVISGPRMRNLRRFRAPRSGLYACIWRPDTITPHNNSRPPDRLLFVKPFPVEWSP